MNEGAPKKNNDSQIDRAFNTFSDNISKHLNPEYSDDSATQEKKEKLDNAFESLKKFHPGKIIDINDTEMLNIIGSAFLPYSSIKSTDEIFEVLNLGSDINKDDIERVSENKWIIKTQDALRKIQIGIRDEHRTLKRKDE